MNIRMKVMNWMVIVLSGLMLAAHADERDKKPEKFEIRHSMIGYRSTLVFYSFTEQKAVLVVEINNQDESFPVTGTVHLFEATTSAEELRKWINNQHSDALFIDAPTPVIMEKLPVGFCEITARKQTGTSENPGPAKKKIFKDFEVDLSIKARDVGGKIKLPAFTDTVRVHVESK